MRHLTSKNLVRWWLLLLLAPFFLLACQSETTQREEQSTPEKPAPSTRGKRTLALAFDNWSGTYLPMYVLKSLLEDKLGYRVKIHDASTVPGAFEAVASGRADIFTSGWFPSRDTTYDKYPNLVKLGQVYGGKSRDAFEGLMVFGDVGRQHQLKHVRDLRKRSVVIALDTDGNGKGNLIGCPADWACAKQLPEILKDYGLSHVYEIDEQRSEKTLMTAIEQRLRANQSAFFYMLQPAALPAGLSRLDDGIWLQGTEPYLPISFNRAVVGNTFIVKHPDVAQVLEAYAISGTAISSAMKTIEKKGTSPQTLKAIARDWIDRHRPEVDAWLSGIEKPARTSSLNTDMLTIAYSPEKEELFLKLATAFNRSRPKDIAPIHPIRMAIEEMIEGAVQKRFEAISPDSSIWLAQLDRQWQRLHPNASSLVGASTRYAVSPIVIAMWERVASKMGHPGQAIGWQDLLKRVQAEPGFRWSHQSTTTASGLLATTALFYAGANKQANLTQEDLESDATIDYVKAIEATVKRYGGESEDRVVVRMLGEGGYPLDALVTQEQMVVYYNRNTSHEKLVAIYPTEGTLWMDHPLVLLDGPWVTEVQRRAFRQFASFVSEPEQQRLILQQGYRPGQLTTSLQAKGSLIQPTYGVNPDEPKTLLKVPSAGMLERIRNMWLLTKRSANIYLVVDVSGSMAGEKLSSTKGALFSFLEQIKGKKDQVALLPFSNTVQVAEPLGLLNGRRRSSFDRSIRELKAGGGTLLYDAIGFAYDQIREHADTERTNAIVAMTDGQSQGEIDVLEQKLRQSDLPVLIFTVAYGADADEVVLQRIARLGDGRAYPSDSETIEQLYKILSAFF